MLILMSCKRDDVRLVLKLSMLPGSSNVYEPVMFGSSIGFDPIYSISFILAPVVMVLLLYGAVVSGLVLPM